MSDYLNTLTVKALREIAKRIGFRFISRYRKAQLIDIISAEIDACHTEAIREDKIRTRQSAPKVSLIDFPAVDGRVVTEAHAKICRDRGCSTYVKNGIDMGFCPRCGEVSTSEEQITDEEITSGVIVPDVEIIPAMLSEYGYSAHGNTYAIDYNRVHVSVYGESLPDLFKKEESISEEKASDPIADVIRFANEAIAALMPNLAATKLAFETLRDDESASPAHVDLAYQVYSDTYRAIEEYRRTIAYAESN